MDGNNLTPQEEKLNQLKEILPEVFSEGKVDWEKLKAALGEDVNFSNERYVLNWAGKSDAFKVLQSPSSSTLIPAKDESVDFDTTENIFIEGENLEVLKVLQKSYFGKVKMIYIDPPYNTGSDSFIYPDKFGETKEEYAKRVGDKDEEGYLIKDGMFKKNSRENGQYHSNWLNMMYPRLFLAKNLLRQDGLIFVSIDDNEVHNLRLLMNEVFGEENFIESIVWKKRYGGGAKEKYLVSLHEYILVYAKNLDSVNPMFIPLDEASIKRYYTKKDEKYEVRGGYRTHPLEATKSMGERKNLVYPIPSPYGNIMPKRQWLWGKERALEALENNDLEFIKDRNGNYSVHTKQYLKDENGKMRQSKAFSIIDDVYTQHGTNEIIDLFGDAQMFSFPKPTALLKKLINVAIEEKGEIVMDLFCGSASTAHAVLELNADENLDANYVCVQLPELCEEGTVPYENGFKTIADVAKERIRLVASRLQNRLQEKEAELEFDNVPDKNLDLGLKVFYLTNSSFKQWQQIEGKDVNALEQQMKLFVDPVSENAEIQNMVYELLLKSGKDLNSKIDFKDNYHSINDNELVLILEKAEQSIIDAVLEVKPQKVIALDRLFKGNDQLKTNTSLQMKDAGIEFKTI